MKNLVYLGLGALGVAALFSGPRAPQSATVHAQTVAAAPAPTSPIKGDLVIDFLGAVRGYVEPCG